MDNVLAEKENREMSQIVQGIVEEEDFITVSINYLMGDIKNNIAHGKVKIHKSEANKAQEIV